MHIARQKDHGAIRMLLKANADINKNKTVREGFFVIDDPTCMCAVSCVQSLHILNQ